MKFASICILAYKRPEMLRRCLDSLHETIDFPCEIIVNDDSGLNRDFLVKELAEGRISKLILQQGKNRGVGFSFQSCIGIAEGETIIKVDSDLVFKQNWLSSAISILDNHPQVGAVSLFNYRNYDPNDERFSIYRELDDCYLVSDFVSSIYAFRNVPDQYPLFMPDDGFHTTLGDQYGHLAITKTDLCTNEGFGEIKSVYVSRDEQGNLVKTPTHNTPLLFGMPIDAVSIY